MRQERTLLIIGIGNEYRSDDAAGLLVVRLLHETALPQARVIEHGGEGAALLEEWTGADALIMVDAVASGAAPGTIHRFDARTHPLPACLRSHSTHAFSVAEAVELARSLGRLPARVIVYGIEGHDFAAGVGLSPEVEAAVPLAAAQIERAARKLAPA